MAVTRKYDPAVGNAVAQALQAAMGRPVAATPPDAPPPSADLGSAPAQTTSWVSLRITQQEVLEPESE